MLLARALNRAGLVSELRDVNSAEKGIDYLLGRGEYQDREAFPLPSLIILDLSLPGMSGADFLRWLRRKPEVGQTLVVVVSGSPFEEDVRECYGLGARTFFVKPLASADVDALVGLILRYCAGKPAGPAMH